MIPAHHLPHLANFYFPWAASVAASLAAGPETTGPMVFAFDGMSVPVLPLVLAMAGVLLARPPAPRSEKATGPVKFVLVTVIMLIVAAAWVAQSQPGVLFAFVVSIGLGFSGYSLIELAGSEIEAFIKGIFKAVRPGGDNRGGSSQ